SGHILSVAPSLEHFLSNKFTRKDFEGERSNLAHFAKLDDIDILSAIKTWTAHPDRVLSSLCTRLMRRELHHTELYKSEPDSDLPETLKRLVCEEFGLKETDADWCVWSQ